MYRWVDHTSELELRLEAESEDAIFEEALAALAELLSERSQPGEAETASREVTASAADRATLLAEWLNELVYLAESEGLVPVKLERLALAGTALEASVRCRRGFPPHLVKAVTYHRLGMWEDKGTWRVRVVLDV